MASYPNNIFATGSYRPTTNEPLIINKHWDSIANEIPAIESELGTNPSGYAADVKTRLNTINPSSGLLAANGLQFPGTQSPSADANTLDDYEEGSFTTSITPTVSGSVTLNSSLNTLTYVRIGSFCNVVGYISIQSVSSPTGAFYFTLPFLCKNANQYRAAAFIRVNGINSGSIMDFWGEIPANSNQVYVYLGTGTNVSSNSAQQLSANPDMRISISYLVQ